MLMNCVNFYKLWNLSVVHFLGGHTRRVMPANHSIGEYPMRLRTLIPLFRGNETLGKCLALNYVSSREWKMPFIMYLWKVHFFCKYECPHVCISECRRRSEVTWRAEGRAQVLLLILLFETGSLLSSPTLYTRWSSLWASVDCPVSASHLTQGVLRFQAYLQQIQPLMCSGDPNSDLVVLVYWTMSSA